MTTTAKVIIGILAAGAIGTGAYFAFRPKKKDEAAPGRSESALPPIPDEVIAEITKPSDMLPMDNFEPQESKFINIERPTLIKRPTFINQPTFQPVQNKQGVQVERVAATSTLRGYSNLL